MKREFIKDPSASNTTLLAATTRTEFSQKDSVTSDLIALLNANEAELSDGLLDDFIKKNPAVELIKAFENVVLAAEKDPDDAMRAALRIRPYFATAVEGNGLALKELLERTVTKYEAMAPVTLRA